jgi:hypothetical protein
MDKSTKDRRIFKYILLFGMDIESEGISVVIQRPHSAASSIIVSQSRS